MVTKKNERVGKVISDWLGKKPKRVRGRRGLNVKIRSRRK